MAVGPDERREQSWWTVEDPEERARVALEWSRKLETTYGPSQRSRELRLSRLYEGEWAPSAGGPVATVENSIQQVVDSFMSDITRDRVSVQFQTSAADYGAQHSAQQMRRVIEADFDEAGLYDDEGFELCRDGLCLGEGCVKTTIDFESGCLIDERIRSSRVFADARDARLGKPRCWGYFDHYAPELLVALYPKQKAAIEEAEEVGYEQLVEEANSERAPAGVDMTKRVMVYECWHLPSQTVADTSDDSEWTEGAKHDGRHMVLIQTRLNGGTPAVLWQEPWPLPMTLITSFRPMRRMAGWHGHSMAERLEKTQLEINQLGARESLIMKLFSRIYFGVDEDKLVGVEQLGDNNWAGIIKVKGNPAQAIVPIAPAVVPPDLPRRREQLSQYARDYSGKTELTMSGKKPAGQMSGIALEHLIDQDSLRNSYAYKRFQRFFVDLAKLHIEGYQLLASRIEGFEARWNADNDFGKVKWSKIALKRDRYRVRPAPVSFLPSSPAGQIDAATKLVESGALPPSALGRILGEKFADIAQLTAPESAAQKAAEVIVDRVRREGKLTVDTLPSGFMALDLVHRLALAAFNQAIADGVEDTKVLVALKNLAEKAQELMPPPPAPPPLPVSGPAGAGVMASPPVPAAPPVPGSMAAPIGAMA